MNTLRLEDSFASKISVRPTRSYSAEMGARANCSRDHFGRSDRKEGNLTLRDSLHFPPSASLEVSGLGTATLLEAVGTTQNMKGEKMFDKMSARCTALSVDSGPKKYIDGACVLADADGDKIFSTFDTRDVDKSQPSMGCGTHIITGGTGKYAGITGSEPFACRCNACTGRGGRLYRDGHPA
jgi:hypothetical protein